MSTEHKHFIKLKTTWYILANILWKFCLYLTFFPFENLAFLKLHMAKFGLFIFRDLATLIWCLLNPDYLVRKMGTRDNQASMDGEHCQSSDGAKPCSKNLIKTSGSFYNVFDVIIASIFFFLFLFENFKAQKVLKKMATYRGIKKI